MRKTSMRKISVRLAITIILGFALASTSYPASLAGIILPDANQVGGTTLVLNGLGLRTKYMVKVYVAGLYLEHKSSDANAVLQADVTKRIVMQFVHSVSKDQMADAFDESFSENAPDARKTMKADVDRFCGALEALRDGDQMVLTYVPAVGTTLAVTGRDKLTIPGPAFGQMLFSVWLGPKPPNAGLKKGLLGE